MTSTLLTPPTAPVKTSACDTTCWDIHAEQLLEHGGNLLKAAAKKPWPITAWMDLSAALNPEPFPIPSIAIEDWQQLPEEHDDLLDSARQYYGTPSLLAVAGSQQAIQLLATHANKRLRVGVLAHSYQEHRHCWQRAGHTVQAIELPLPALAEQDQRQAEHTICQLIEQHLPVLDILILVNPNNPTGYLLPADKIRHWQQLLRQRGGALIIDEAFIDPTPEHSVIAHADNHLIVLRSLGKFFGLAGARVGFVASSPALLGSLKNHIGPWPIARPARRIAAAALQDHHWQQQSRHQLNRQSQQLNHGLRTLFNTPITGCALFQYLQHPHAHQLAEHLENNAILVRRFDDASALRFALPPAQDLPRLLQTLRSFHHAPTV